MRRFGAFEAKTHFSELLNEVVKGEKFVITKRGIQVAMIVPFTGEEGVDPIDDAIRAIKTLRKGIRLGRGLTIRHLIDEGRE